MLARLNDPKWNIPVPTPLPIQLAMLRDDSTLMEDVWVSPSPIETPRWLSDVNVRKGIRAMLKIDRCHEERLRLGIEADNLCRWFGRELAGLELALSTPSSKSLKLSVTHFDCILSSPRSFANGPPPRTKRFAAPIEASVG